MWHQTNDSHFEGMTLSYDAGGNLTGDGAWTYSWQAGRELHKMNMTGTSILYDYDQNHQRVRKTINGVATNYTLNGSRIVHLTKGTDWMHFFYDGQGRPAIVNFDGSYYHYLYNLQGDVIGLVDSTGALVVEYKYDAWGKRIGRTGSLATTLGALNPFLYRGYVYDEETQLYYLQSRYYNPNWGRFISPDAVLGQVGSVHGHNLYCYCGNGPVAYKDSSGFAAIASTLTGIAIGEAISGLISFICPPLFAAIGTVGLIGLIDTLATPSESTVYQELSEQVYLCSDFNEGIDYAFRSAVSEKSNITYGYDFHHIVLQSENQCIYATAVLRSVGIEPVIDPVNMVYLSRQFHKHLHNKYYKNGIDLIFVAVEAYSNLTSPNEFSKKKYNIELTLDIIREVLENADAAVMRNIFK